MHKWVQIATVNGNHSIYSHTLKYVVEQLQQT